MSRRLSLQPEPIKRDPIYTHAVWCRWLQSRGALSPQHRRCMQAGHCVASSWAPAEETWRSGRTG